MIGYWTGNLRDDAQPKQATITANSVNRTTRFFIPHPFSYLPAAAPPTCVPSGRGGGLCLVRSWPVPYERDTCPFPSIEHYPAMSLRAVIPRLTIDDAIANRMIELSVAIDVVPRHAVRPARPCCCGCRQAWIAVYRGAAG